MMRRNPQPLCDVEEGPLISSLLLRFALQLSFILRLAKPRGDVGYPPPYVAFPAHHLLSGD
jgi:hypothetical protein